MNGCSPGFIVTDLTRAFVPAGKTPEEMGALPVERSTVAIVKLSALRGGSEASALGRGCYYGSDGLRSPLTSYRSPGTLEYDGAEE